MTTLVMKLPEKRPVGRPRIYASNARRQAAYRQRVRSFSFEEFERRLELAGKGRADWVSKEPADHRLPESY
jgi:hypothetical protein